VVEYCKARGVADGSVPELVLQNPRIFEYKVCYIAKVMTAGVTG